MSKVKGYNELKKAIKDASRLEWEIAVNTNNQRGKVYNHEELLKLYPAGYNGDDNGASKVCHLTAHTGEKFKHICIKRQIKIDKRGWGNQTAQEINCFVNADEELKSVLCPILAYYKVKSDKVNDNDDKAHQKYMIIAQKAVYINDFRSCCLKAFEMNKDGGYYNRFTSYTEMYQQLAHILTKNHIHDWQGHGGNSGIIFDYEKGYYKPVLIDYGL